MTAGPALSNSGVAKPPDTASLPDGHLAVTESSTWGSMTFAFEATFRPGWFVSQYANDVSVPVSPPELRADTVQVRPALRFELKVKIAGPGGVGSNPGFAKPPDTASLPLAQRAATEPFVCWGTLVLLDAVTTLAPATPAATRQVTAKAVATPPHLNPHIWCSLF